MSPELIAIVSVGVALSGLGFRMLTRLDDVDRRLARMANLLEGLGLSGRVPNTSVSGE